MEDWYIIVDDWDDLDGTLIMIRKLSEDVKPSISFPHLFDPFKGSHDLIKKLTYLNSMTLVPSVLIMCADGIIFIKRPGQKCQSLCREFKQQLELRNIKIAKLFNIDITDIIITTKKHLHTMLPYDFSTYMCKEKQVAETTHEYLKTFEECFNNDPINYHNVNTISKILMDEDSFLVHPINESIINNPFLTGILISDYTDLTIVAKAEARGMEVRFGSGRNYMKGE